MSKARNNFEWLNFSRLSESVTIRKQPTIIERKCGSALTKPIKLENDLK
jgi:hypothetical protein